MHTSIYQIIMELSIHFSASHWDSILGKLVLIMFSILLYTGLIVIVFNVQLSWATVGKVNSRYCIKYMNDMLKGGPILTLAKSKWGS